MLKSAKIHHLAAWCMVLYCNHFSVYLQLLTYTDL